MGSGKHLMLRIGLIAAGAGAILMTAAGVGHLVHIGLVKRYLSSLLAIALAFIAILITLIDFYRQGVLAFKNLAILLVDLFVLLSLTFGLLLKVAQ